MTADFSDAMVSLTSDDLFDINLTNNDQTNVIK